MASWYDETTSRQEQRRAARTDPSVLEWLQGGGWQVVRRGREASGLTAHRGVLHPDEYVDRAQLAAAVEERLGFTLDELHAVYQQGRKSNTQRELRARVDARLLAIAETGGNMTLLSRATGLNRKTVGRALRRAKGPRGLSSERQSCGHA